MPILQIMTLACHDKTPHAAPRRGERGVGSGGEDDSQHVQHEQHIIQESGPPPSLSPEVQEGLVLTSASGSLNGSGGAPAADDTEERLSRRLRTDEEKLSRRLRTDDAAVGYDGGYRRSPNSP